jgi:hypothetical protein
MKKIAVALVAVVAGAAFSAPASAATHYLTKEWIQGGSQFCQYSNGTVLNVGAKTCPASF